MGFDFSMCALTLKGVVLRHFDPNHSKRLRQQQTSELIPKCIVKKYFDCCNC